MLLNLAALPGGCVLLSNDYRYGYVAFDGEDVYNTFETLRVERRGSFDTLVPINPHFFWWDGIGRVTCYDHRRNFTDTGFRLTYPVPCVGMEWRAPPDIDNGN